MTTQEFNELKDRLIAATGSPGLTSYADERVTMRLSEWRRLIGFIETSPLVQKPAQDATTTAGRDDNTPAEPESPTEAQRAALVKAWQQGAEHGARKCTFAAEGEQCSYNPYIEEVQS